MKKLWKETWSYLCKLTYVNAKLYSKLTSWIYMQNLQLCSEVRLAPRCCIINKRLK